MLVAETIERRLKKKPVWNWINRLKIKLTHWIQRNVKQFVYDFLFFVRLISCVTRSVLLIVPIFWFLSLSLYLIFFYQSTQFIITTNCYSCSYRCHFLLRALRICRIFMECILILWVNSLLHSRLQCVSSSFLLHLFWVYPIWRNCSK